LKIEKHKKILGYFCSAIGSEKNINHAEFTGRYFTTYHLLSLYFFNLRGVSEHVTNIYLKNSIKYMLYILRNLYFWGFNFRVPKNRKCPRPRSYFFVSSFKIHSLVSLLVAWGCLCVSLTYIPTVYALSMVTFFSLAMRKKPEFSVIVLVNQPQITCYTVEGLL